MVGRGIPAPNVLQENWAKLSARSEHLYQLFAYLEHLERRGGRHEHCEGLLLYPTATHSVDFAFNTQGHTVRAVTLDLREAWNNIKVQMLERCPSRLTISRICEVCSAFGSGDLIETSGDGLAEACDGDRNCNLYQRNLAKN